MTLDRKIKIAKGRGYLGERENSAVGMFGVRIICWGRRVNCEPLQDDSKVGTTTRCFELCKYKLADNVANTFITLCNRMYIVFLM